MGVVWDGRGMFGLIITSSQFVIALGVLAGVLTGLWKAGAWILRWAKRIESTIGTNGGSTIFQQFSLQTEHTERLSDAIAMHSSVVDLIPTPSFVIGPDGEVSSASVPFVVATHLTLEDLRNGGFRNLLTDNQRDRWDEAVEKRATYMQPVIIRGAPYQLVARPKFNDRRFVGWRVVLEAS